MEHGRGNDGPATPALVACRGVSAALVKGDRLDGSIEVAEVVASSGGMPRRARRNIALLAMCQALTQSSNTLMNASSALAVLTIVSPDMRMWANLPITMQHFGVMLSVFPASMLMMRRGRKFGFRSGSAMGMVGASLAAIGLGMGSFAVMCVGGLVLGYGIANMQLYRFAAVELAPGRFRAQAISYVTAGGVLAGILGPGLARFTPDLWLPTFQATLCAIIGVHAIAFVVLGFIEFPAVRAGGLDRPAAAIARDRHPAGLHGRLRRRRHRLRRDVLRDGGLAACHRHVRPDKTEAPITIFVHVMGMFVPAFFTGHLIARHGVFKMMMAGIALLVAGVVAALVGVTEWHFRIALCLNGVGWNFLFVGATTLLTTTYRPAERGKAQAFNDFMVFGTTTTASLMASVVLDSRAGPPSTTWRWPWSSWRSW